MEELSRNEGVIPPKISPISQDETDQGAKPPVAGRMGLNQHVHKLSHEQVSQDQKEINRYMGRVTENLAKARSPDAQPGEHSKLEKQLGFHEITNDPRQSVVLKKGIVGKIARFALRVIGKGQQIEKMRSEARLLDERDAMMDLLETEKMIREDVSSIRNNTGANQYVDSSDEVSTLSLPKASSIAKAEENFGRKKKLNKTTAARAHVNLGGYEKGIEDLQAGDGNSWHCMKISLDENGKPQITHNALTPTAERAALGSTDLNNVMVHINDRGHISIMTGVMDSEKRAKQFMAAVGWAMKERARLEEERGEPFPEPANLRISFHQLNAFGVLGVGESKLIKNERQAVDFIDAHLKEHLIEEGIDANSIGDGPYTSHLNRSFNGFTNLPQEDAKNHASNRTGLATQMTWMQQDIESQLTGLSDELSGIGQASPTLEKNIAGYSLAQQRIALTNKNLRQLKAEKFKLEAAGPPPSKEAAKEVKLHMKQLDRLLADREDTKEELRHLGKQDPNYASLEAKLKNHENDIAAIRHRLNEITPKSPEQQARLKEVNQAIASNEKALKGQLKELAIAVRTLELEIPSEGPLTQGTKELKLKLQTAGHLLAIQTEQTEALGFNELGKGQEIQLMLFLDRLNGTITQSNCKSQCDRNNHSRSSGPAMDQKTAGYKRDDNLHIDAMANTYEFITGFDGKVKEMDRAWRDFHRENPGSSFKDFLKTAEGESYQEVADYQVKMTAEFLGVGLPTTFWSTGLKGFKWHHDKKTINPFEKNPHPMPYIPAQVFDQDRQGWVTLVDINSKGERNFTPEGLALFMGTSQKRGA